MYMILLKKIEESMGNKFAKIAFTANVKEIQELMGSRKNYAKTESGPEFHHELTDDEALFIGERDSFYIATVSETGWPYIQHRGGPKGFLKVLNKNEIGFADFSGNRQYISVGNLKNNDRVAIILVDYPNQARLKILGRATIIDDKNEKLAQLVPADYKAKTERGFVIQVEAFDWNCPQHITPRWTASDIQDAIQPLKDKIQELEETIQRLQKKS